jgi:hypothetical protein
LGENSIPTDLVLTEDGGNFKASANLADYGKIEIVLSSVTKLPASFFVGAGADPGTVSGYLFKVKPQDITLSISPIPIKIEGADMEFDDESITGYHGFVVKGKENGQEHRGIGILLKVTGMSSLVIVIFSPEEE